MHWSVSQDKCRYIISFFQPPPPRTETGWRTAGGRSDFEDRSDRTWGVKLKNLCTKSPNQLCGYWLGGGGDREDGLRGLKSFVELVDETTGCGWKKANLFAHVRHIQTMGKHSKIGGEPKYYKNSKPLIACLLVERGKGINAVLWYRLVLSVIPDKCLLLFMITLPHVFRNTFHATISWMKKAFNSEKKQNSCKNQLTLLTVDTCLLITKPVLTLFLTCWSA